MSRLNSRQANAQSNTEVTSGSRITTSVVAYYVEVVHAANSPQFSDEENTITIENWTTRMTIIFCVHKIPHNLKARIAAMHLKEYPVVWWEISQDKIMSKMSWNSFQFAIER